MAAIATDDELEATLLTASTALIFGAFLGGVVKLLLDDLQRQRARREEQARFVKAVLDDLKKVYDRVERARILVAAHRSAKTYGSEMRDLIDAQVQLRNVIRAVDLDTSGIREEQSVKVGEAVASMEQYLLSLTTEFRETYKPIADLQRIWDDSFTQLIKAHDAGQGPLTAPANPAWEALEKLEVLGEFRSPNPEDYERDFVEPLDSASAVLRNELKWLA